MHVTSVFTNLHPTAVPSCLHALRITLKGIHAIPKSEEFWCVCRRFSPRNFEKTTTSARKKKRNHELIPAPATTWYLVNDGVNRNPYGCERQAISAQNGDWTINNAARRKHQSMNAVHINIPRPMLGIPSYQNMCAPRSELLVLVINSREGAAGGGKKVEDDNIKSPNEWKKTKQKTHKKKGTKIRRPRLSCSHGCELTATTETMIYHEFSPCERNSKKNKTSFVVYTDVQG